MEPILYLAHRIPFPPNKGDKIRSYHLLRFLAQRYRVHLGTFVDRPEDHVHVRALGALTTDRHVASLNPALARARSLSGLLRGEALTVPYYRSAALARWIEASIREHGIRKAVVFSSAMAQYVVGARGLQVVADFCDLDSAKWTQYADTKRWPASAVFRREGARLLAFERAVASGVAATTFATAPERELLARFAPELAPRLHVVGNGVDTEYFAPDAARPSPFAPQDVPIVFTGAMDYWPNIDAVGWFAREVLPALANRWPGVRFYVVGMNAAAAVRALADDPRVVVTGAVADVRPYLQHARAVVVPLRIARGVQNKVLEAMAMARPVVTTAACAAPLTPDAQRALVIADDARDFARELQPLLASERRDLGTRARAAVRADYCWDANLSRFGQLLEGLSTRAPQGDGARGADGKLAAVPARGAGAVP
jgi:sugar transferase (PEP-CTERM/EpsH1 system associated)